MPYYDIYEAYVMMAECKRHRFIVCTKRPERIRGFLTDYEILPQDCPNVLHMTTAGTQKTADANIGNLLSIKELDSRWPLGLSAEPLLEEINIRNPAWYISNHGGMLYHGLDWVVTGCESGGHRRHTDIEWFQSLRDQCNAAGVPFFLKQADIGGTIMKVPALDGIRHDALPEILTRPI
jgi:protein gp37